MRIFENKHICVCVRVCVCTLDVIFVFSFPVKHEVDYCCVCRLLFYVCCGPFFQIQYLSDILL